MHPRIARLLYLLGGEVHRFQNICVEGLNCGLYLFIYFLLSATEGAFGGLPP